MVVIAISGQPGAGSTTTAKLLADRLHYHYFSPGRVFKDISRGIIQNQFYYPEFKKRCDSIKLTIPVFTQTDDTHGTVDLWKTEFGKNPRLHKVIDDLQKSVASGGNAVLDGKLSLHMIPEATLKVWLKASRQQRAKRVFDRDNLPISEAESLLGERETLERKEWKSMYGLDYWEQEGRAHLVIDTGDKSPSQVALLIEQHVGRNSAVA